VALRAHETGLVSWLTNAWSQFVQSVDIGKGAVSLRGQHYWNCRPQLYFKWSLSIDATSQLTLVPRLVQYFKWAVGCTVELRDQFEHWTTESSQPLGSESDRFTRDVDVAHH
jgi:hypothetical protein